MRLEVERVRACARGKHRKRDGEDEQGHDRGDTHASRPPTYWSTHGGCRMRVRRTSREPQWTRAGTRARLLPPGRGEPKRGRTDLVIPTTPLPRFPPSRGPARR